MRHGDKINNLGRKKAHREALLSNLAAQLIIHKRIVTTLAKAKALRVYVEPMITKTKKNENELQISHNHRLVFKYLQNKEAVKELFTVVGPKVATRPGGYTRIIKLGIRPGDNAEKALIELVDFNEVYGVEATTQDTAKKTRRSRRSAGTAKAEDAPAPKAKKESTAKGDDLKKIEGVGPKAAEALHAAGINSFADMAGKSAEELKEILDAADGSFNALVTDTWAQQAQLAADGKWDELQALQDELKGGKEVTPDDLAKIEGIGPKAAEALIAAGIKTFADVAKKTPEQLKEVLDAADGSFNALVPDTWPQQAQLAADEKWEELEKLQDELKGGKEA